MNTKSIDFTPFIEFDSNPFILFSSNGRLIYVNSSAEVLLGHVSQKEVFNLALSYAPQDFGFKNTNIELSYDVFNFHAIMVGYENEEELAIRLYNKPIVSTVRTFKHSTLITTDINILLEANIALFKNRYKDNKLKLLVDQDIPEFKIDQNSIAKLMRDILELFKTSNAIDISLKMVIGSHIIIDNKKSSLVEISIKGTDSSLTIESSLTDLAKNNHVKIIQNSSNIKLEIPIIL